MRTSARWRNVAWWAAVLALCGASLVLVAAQDNPARNVLWVIVHMQCVPNQEQHHDPAPCTLVNLDGGEARGYAILKDIRGTSQYLLIATGRVPGIESKELLAGDAPNYFEEAWEASNLVGHALHKKLPREDLSVAINSARSRSQDQLHIHIDCVRADVRAAVRQHVAMLDSHWSNFPVPLVGHRYQAIWEPGETLTGSDPFQLLVAGVSGAAQDMGNRTLVAVGASGSDGMPGFVIFEDEADLARRDLASGEDLQDHACAVAADAPAATSNADPAN